MAAGGADGESSVTGKKKRDNADETTTRGTELKCVDGFSLFFFAVCLFFALN